MDMGKYTYVTVSENSSTVRKKIRRQYKYKRLFPREEYNNLFLTFYSFLFSKCYFL